jgi:hypothetical protein
MASDLPDPEHLDWLVQHRTANQSTAAKLYRLFREYRPIIGESPFANEAQLLVSVAFSLWRSAFLSDKTGRLSDAVKDAEWFLGEMLLTNAIAFVQDKKAKDWTFNYYIGSARGYLEIYARDNSSDFALGNLSAKAPKERWEIAYNAFKRAVEHFSLRLKAEAKKRAKS